MKDLTRRLVDRTRASFIPQIISMRGLRKHCSFLIDGMNMPDAWRVDLQQHSPVALTFLGGPGFWRYACACIDVGFVVSFTRTTRKRSWILMVLQPWRLSWCWEGKSGKSSGAQNLLAAIWRALTEMSKFINSLDGRWKESRSTVKRWILPQWIYAKLCEAVIDKAYAIAFKLGNETKHGFDQDAFWYYPRNEFKTQCRRRQEKGCINRPLLPR